MLKHNLIEMAEIYKLEYSSITLFYFHLIFFYAVHYILVFTSTFINKQYDKLSRNVFVLFKRLFFHFSTSKNIGELKNYIYIYSRTRL